MLTDWSLIRRAGSEIAARLQGARVAGAGTTDDGRFGLALRLRGQMTTLAIAPFASPPTLALADAIPHDEPGAVRAMAAALSGMVLDAVVAPDGERLLRLSFAARSRFGVRETRVLVVELVPRFGNIVLLKGETIVCALKEFSPGERSQRAVAAGLPYAPPPPPPGLLPKLAAQSGWDEATFVRFARSEQALHAPVHVYRRDGALVQAHLIDLHVEGEHVRQASLLDVFAELQHAQRARAEYDRAYRRREAARKRVDELAEKLRGELVGLDALADRAQRRDRARDAGSALYATLHELPETERPQAKARAAALFAEYKRLGSAAAHLAQRRQTLERTLEACESLRWEIDRGSDDDLDDVETAVAQLRPHRAQRSSVRPARKRKRVPLEFRTALGSRILVGRSPLENDELTFRLARPHDLWFHARGTPGAHVVLARDDRSDPPAQDIQSAAALAAFHSKARAGGSVAVDYAIRKHVRKRRDAPPGLVWYTNAKTVIVAPRETA